MSSASSVLGFDSISHLLFARQHRISSTQARIPVSFKFDVFFLFSSGGILLMSLIARPFSPFPGLHLRRCYFWSAEFWVVSRIGGRCWWSELIGSACQFVPSVLVPRWGSACICVYLYVVYKMVWRRIRVFGVRDINLIDYDVILDNQVDERVDWSLRWTNRCVYEGGKRWGWRRWDCRKSLLREANHGLQIPLIAKAVMLPFHSGTEKYDISTCISNLKMCIVIQFMLKYIQICHDTLASKTHGHLNLSWKHGSLYNSNWCKWRSKSQLPQSSYSSF